MKLNESSSFFLRVHNSRWLKRVSSIISLTTKIINCLHYSQHNVFLEESRTNKDCSCILTSLVKICLHHRYRTVVGFENLIQKEWFLSGHLFDRRLNALEDEYERKSMHEDAENANKSIAPTFLLFLDCVFQLTQQFPKEFQFNELYLIHMWDYTCSSISLTFSFDGYMNWINYLNNRTFLASNLPANTAAANTLSLPIIDNSYLNKVYEANMEFWMNHLSSSPRSALLKNQNYNELRTSLKDLVLNPDERLFMLKFWSRCYLRWHEKHHLYQLPELDAMNYENKIAYDSLKPTRPAPSIPTETIRSPGEDSVQYLPRTAGTIKVIRRETPDGNIESSF